MAGYCTIRGDQLWYDRAVEGLSDTAHRLLMYCFHGPGRTMLGVRRFTPQDALARVPAWTMETAQAALEELQAAGLVEYDTDTRLLFVVPYFDHSPVKGVKSISGAINALEGLPDSPVLAKPLKHVLEAVQHELGKPQKEHARQELTGFARALETRLAKVNALKTEPEGQPDTHPQVDSGLETASEANSDAPSMGHPGYASHPGWGIQGTQPTSDGASGVSGTSETRPDAPSMGHPPRARTLPDPEPDPEPNPPLKPPP